MTNSSADSPSTYQELQSDFIRINGPILLRELFRDEGDAPEELVKLKDSFDGLIKDPYVPNEFGIRKRRFGRFHWIRDEQLRLVSGTTFVQSSKINRIAGDIQREFAPLEESFQDSYLLNRLIENLAKKINSTSKEWKVNVHQFRVEARGGPASAAPEGIHRDGHDFIAIISCNRHNIEGGYNRIYNDQKELLLETMLDQPFDTLLINDRLTYHDVTPFQAPRNSIGHRDTLVIDFNSL